jgi:CDP-paratose 2-epimerase
MKRKPTVVIGGCGFIGAHCIVRLLREGHRVLCVDNLSRATAQANLRWIMDSRDWPLRHFTFVYADIRNSSDLEGALKDYSKCDGSPELIIHQAAQVAVTQSVAMPRNDFETNALGTFNVLEAVRQICPEATVIFASTNKVYGSLKGIRIRETQKRYEFQDLSSGVNVDQPLDFYSPYGCSKGAADQYVRDYARIFKLRSIVFRQSCIYGCRQFGHEDQGWVAWFVIAALLGRRSTIFGNGKQVRDLLWVDDLVDAYWKAWQGPVSGGEIFNIGGGPQNTLSLLELLEMLEQISPSLLPPRFSEWRPADQPVYVSDVQELRNRLAWEPTVSPREGVEKLWAWGKEYKEEIEAVLFARSGMDEEIKMSTVTAQ